MVFHCDDHDQNNNSAVDDLRHPVAINDLTQHIFCGMSLQTRLLIDAPYCQVKRRKMQFDVVVNKG
jgi:hypothetical protein